MQCDVMLELVRKRLDACFCCVAFILQKMRAHIVINCDDLDSLCLVILQINTVSQWLFVKVVQSSLLLVLFIIGQTMYAYSY